MKNIVCFGEVLWDVLPTGRKLGGAPLNVALRAQSWGNRSKMISSIGADRRGEELAEEIVRHGGSLEYIQVSESLPTSEVLVELDQDGSASYDIKMPCAWDKILLTDRDAEAVKTSDAFIYGSLVARNSTSRETLFALLKKARYSVFDVNLRPPHYTPARILDLMNAADFVKFNDEELYALCSHLQFHDCGLEAAIGFLAKHTRSGQICVTLGGDGGVLYYGDTFYYNRGYQVEVADTVGAGDSFLASIISRLLHGSHPQEALDFACAVGAVVASKRGANPEVSLSELTRMLSA